MGYYIGMDVGGTYARLKIVNEAGEQLHVCEGQGGTIASVGFDKMRERFRSLLLPALEHAMLQPADCLGLCLGASGIDSPELKTQYEGILTEMGFPLDMIQACNDCELLLSLFDDPCVVLISGTGSIAMGKAAPDAPLCRCGGWSYILSDEGSAPAISFAAMRAILKHWDGQLSCPILADLFTQTFGLNTPQALTAWCHQHLRHKDLLARTAPLVAQAAQAGDLCARAILDDAAQQLFALVDTTAIKIAAPEGRFSLLLWGSVATQNESIRHELCRLLLANHPNAQAYTLSTSALECAVELAMGHPVRGLLLPADEEAC